MIPYFRTSVAQDVSRLAPLIRDTDVEEVKAQCGLNIHNALLMSYESSKVCNSIMNTKGDILGMFGITETPDPLVATPWMLCTDRLNEISRIFLRQSKSWIVTLNTLYPILMNYVDERNQKAIHWLRYLGFTFIQKIERYGVGKKPFYEFVRIS
jgi:hypothetical protein